MVQEIRYKGLTRLPSDVSSFDGEMEEVYNLFNVNGELRPYVPPEQIGTLSGVLRFVHKNQGWEHLITLDGSEIRAYNYDGYAITELGTITNIYGETVRTIDSVGNILVIITNMEVKYCLWKTGSYKYIGNRLPFPRIDFSLSHFASLSTFVDMSEYTSDMTKLESAAGFDTVNPRGTGGSRASSTSSGQLLSSDFENQLRGAINSMLEKYRKENRHVFPFFIRYALRLFDGTLVRHSPPILLLPTKFYPFEAGIRNDVNDKVYLRYHSAKLQMSHDSIDMSQYSDIITGVDIFMSEPIYTYEQDGFVNGVMDKPADASPWTDKFIGGLFYDKEKTLKDIGQTSHFYKIASVSIEKLKQVSPAADLKTTVTESLVQNELMQDDYLSHHKITAASSFVYNTKLHLSGVEQELFSGFSFPRNPAARYDIQFNCGNMRPASANVEITASPYIFYPDPRATSFIAKNIQDRDGIYVLSQVRVAMSRHEYLNGSFYLNPDLEVFDPFLHAEESTMEGYEVRPASENMLNMLLVSEMSNPFVFRAQGRVTLPVGQIIAVASNTTAISSGQFGQFPLYAFTDDGIWAMEVSSDGKYLARQPVSREVIINPNVLQMDNYIAFISKRGLNILSGSSTECITEIVREVNTRSSKVSITSFVVGADTTEVQAKYNTVPIEEYMLSCELAYEYINGQGRIYMINNNFDYCYVFDIMSKSWSKVQGKYRNSVANYPDCYVQNTSGNIFNLASIREGQGDITTMYMTRPIKMEQALFSLKQLAHVGVFNNGDVLTCVYASRDGINYAPIASGRNRLLRISGTPYRYYKVAVIANLQPNETLSSIQLNVEPKFTNRIR